ncbi:MAG: hypothetical protein ACLQDY_08670 [Streptosporangiaceae bacterium]|jgi:hypothetical protein
MPQVLAVNGAVVAAGHGLGVIPWILIVTGVVAGYCLLVLARPLGVCPACRGKRMRRPRRGGRQLKARKCGLCDATGIHRMPGATAIHRFFWSMAGDLILGRRREEAARRTAAKKESTR